MALLLVVFVAGCGREQGVIFPTLSAISPNRGTQGQTVAVTLTGTSFATGATINGTGTGIVVSNATVVNSTQITATLPSPQCNARRCEHQRDKCRPDHQHGDVYNSAPTYSDFHSPHQWRIKRADQSGALGNLQSAVACATITTTGTAPTLP